MQAEEPMLLVIPAALCLILMELEPEPEHGPWVPRPRPIPYGRDLDILDWRNWR